MTHYLTLAWTRNNETISELVTIPVEGEQNIDVSVPDLTTNEELACVIDVSQLALVFIDSDKDVTIKTNSSSAPDETIPITGGKPYLWYTGFAGVNKFATDITKLFITNASGGTAAVKIRYGYDATP